MVHDEDMTGVETSSEEVRKTGLPIEAVARMQVKSGQPWIAFLTLSENGHSADAAKAWVLRELNRR